MSSILNGMFQTWVSGYGASLYSSIFVLNASSIFCINTRDLIQVDSLAMQNVSPYQLLTLAQNPLWHKEASHAAIRGLGGEIPGGEKRRCKGPGVRAAWLVQGTEKAV